MIFNMNSQLEQQFLVIISRGCPEVASLEMISQKSWSLVHWKPMAGVPALQIQFRV